ncbi:type III-B CRISPR module RAMP protein Cmr4 [Lutibacter maritimus]|uniref:CRISPR-associated protein, Cmr4 family n=1 Tax=Lutibacter maritimus TaxID=593133 RepID=A0A1I6SR52_9FLAO|nr:type III-B CRISPR module RAMP protein Cmr4 [Lutibacter maritimus]SFS79359.1 CRISPR-associated protein, Cmr4 family [Lutibacter maritimus]
MSQEKRILFLYCEEPVHAGKGTSTGTIDLPIQRESHTNLPKFEGSGLRGAIREAIGDNIGHDDNDFNRIFGNRHNGEKHSAVDFTDASILFFPVRSAKGIIAWLTCPFVLNRFARDVNKMFGQTLEIKNLSSIDGGIIITQKCSNIELDKKVVLEEFLFTAIEKDVQIDGKGIGTWILEMLGNITDNEITNMLKTNIGIVEDEVFRDFTELFTPKITRNSIDPNTGIANETGLFNEEFLPPETILYAFATADDEFKEKEDERLTAKNNIKFIDDDLPTLFKAGGDKGIGKGLLRRSLYPINTAKTE